MFLGAVEDGWADERLKLAPDDELGRFMLKRFDEMRRENIKLQDKLQRKKERIEALTTELYFYRKRAQLERKLAEADREMDATDLRYSSGEVLDAMKEAAKP